MAQAPNNWTQVGMLTCKLNPSVGFVIFGHQSMECRFVQNPPFPVQFYEGALNTASRLQGVAPEMGVAVGLATYEATEVVFDYAELEPAALKGKAQPVRVFSAAYASSAIWDGSHARAHIAVHRS